MSKSFYFDDCPICQAMKKADKEKRETSAEELIKAFKKAKKKYPDRTYINPLIR